MKFAIISTIVGLLAASSATAAPTDPAAAPPVELRSGPQKSVISLPHTSEPYWWAKPFATDKIIIRQAKPDDYIGWRKGDYKTFSCPTGQWITQIMGRAAIDVKAIRFFCSDGSSSQMFGSRNDGFEYWMPYSADGIRTIAGKSTGTVRALAYNRRIMGVPSTDKSYVMFSDQSGKGCRMNGVNLFSDGTTVNAINFQFQCPY